MPHPRGTAPSSRSDCDLPSRPFGIAADSARTSGSTGMRVHARFGPVRRRMSPVGSHAQPAGRFAAPAGSPARTGPGARTGRTRSRPPGARETESCDRRSRPLAFPHVASRPGGSDAVERRTGSAVRRFVPKRPVRPALARRRRHPVSAPHAQRNLEEEDHGVIRVAIPVARRLPPHPTIRPGSRVGRRPPLLFFSDSVARGSEVCPEFRPVAGVTFAGPRWRERIRTAYAERMGNSRPARLGTGDATVANRNSRHVRDRRLRLPANPPKTV